ncbi:unnamed protein product, partial [Ectocarpus fasciculatus]
RFYPGGRGRVRARGVFVARRERAGRKEGAHRGCRRSERTRTRGTNNEDEKATPSPAVRRPAAARSRVPPGVAELRQARHRSVHHGYRQGHRRGGPVGAPGRVTAAAPFGVAAAATDHRQRVATGMLTRLNTGQRISKRDLMEADLTVVDSSLTKSKKPSSVSGVTGFDMPNDSATASKGSGGCVNEKSWLVLYCGANGKVEQAVQTASEGLNVTWRKEYFSKW